MLHGFHKTTTVSELQWGEIVNAKNLGFRVYDLDMVTYEQNKLGLSTYNDKSYVLCDGIHTRPLKVWLITITLWIKELKTWRLEVTMYLTTMQAIIKITEKVLHHHQLKMQLAQRGVDVTS